MEVQNVFISKKEKKYFTFLFSRYQKKHASKELIITSDAVKELFLKSRIENANLGKIWKFVADGNNNYLTEMQFYRALKLISIKQNFTTLDNAKNLLKCEL